MDLTYNLNPLPASLLEVWIAGEMDQFYYKKKDSAGRPSRPSKSSRGPQLEQRGDLNLFT